MSAPRVLALWCPDWPVVAAVGAEGVPVHRPAAVVAANRVLACSAPARAYGVRRGLRRREAQARCPELAVLSADLQVQVAPSEQITEAAREALAVLRQAEELPGAKLVVYRAQEHLARLLGDEIKARDSAARAEGLVPGSVWEHLALGSLLLNDGKLQEAAAEFYAAVDLEPQEFWANFYAGRAAFEIGRFEESVRSFTACVALAPRAAWCYYNRGLAHAALADRDQARRDFEKALELDPDLADLATKLQGD